MDLRALLEDRVAGLSSPATAVHTDELIQSWLEDVRQARYSPEPSRDFLSSVDWLHGDVGQSAKVIVQGLMTKDLSVQPKRVKESHDPTIAMEMRHKKVKEHRVAREQRKARERTRETLANEAHQQARELVRIEEGQARERRRQEERVIAAHMRQIRADIREKERVAKLVALETPPIDNAVAEAERLLRDERKRQSTRAELLRQLEETEALETRQNLKLLHTCFSRWYQVVIESQGKLAKAAAVSEWRLLVRVWSAWRGWVGACAQRREREQATRQLKRQHRLFQMASEHYHARLLSKSLRGWRDWVRRVQDERREEAAKSIYKKKMEALLVAAAQRASKQEDELCTVVETGPMMQTKPASPPPAKQPPTEVTLPPAKQPPLRPPTTQPALWKQAKDELAHVVARVDSETTKNDMKTASTKNDMKTTATKNDMKTTTTKNDMKSASDDVKRKPKVPQPAVLTGMQQRSAAMAERRAARLVRQEARERERAEALARAEQERVREETEQRRAREAERREQRVAAKQLEMEREQRRQHMVALTNMATQHYRLVQLRRQGLYPWKQFTDDMRRAREVADKARGQSLLKRSFGMWKTAVGQRSLARENLADKLHHQQLLRRAVNSWKQYMMECRRLEGLAEANVTRLLTGRVFRGWRRVVRDERVREWEMDRQARKFRERSLKRIVLKCWIEFVPLSREERAQENRRAELRRKVASWLHDYTPTDPQ